MFGKLICRFRGHLRGKLVKRESLDKRAEQELESRYRAHYACPRCGATWTRKIKRIEKPVQPIHGAMGQKP